MRQVCQWYVPVQDGATTEQLHSQAAAAAVQPIMGQSVDQGVDQAAVMNAVAAYCAAQGGAAQGGDGQPVLSKIAEALSALPPQQLQDRLPPQ